MINQKNRPLVRGRKSGRFGRKTFRRVAMYIYYISIYEYVNTIFVQIKLIFQILTIPCLGLNLGYKFIINQ